MLESVLVCSFILRQGGAGAAVEFPRKATARAIRLLGGVALSETIELVTSDRVDLNGFLRTESEERRADLPPR